MIRAIKLIAFLTSLTSIAFAQNVNFICNAQTSCDECVTASPLCSWCADPISSFSGDRRCYSTEDSTMSCSNPQNPRSMVEETSDDPFSNINQINPQSLSVSLRRGEPVTFNLSVQPAPNFPLDLYLLMDLSFSMNDDLDSLKTLGSQIATTIGNITSNYRLGFGAFVDKRIAPYVDTTPSRLNDPCGNDCEAPYSFKHIVSLSENSDNFNARVQEQVISGNIDSPEGGFDGFLQSIVCQDLIGWRENARKLILYITDAGFHYAGDGKLGGVIEPHTGQCLMGQQDGNNPLFYEDYDVYDFPSIGQIREKLRQEDIIPIFAATRGASSFYTTLASELEGGIVGELATDSSNVVQLISESYNNVSQRVIILPDSVSNIAFNVTPTNCPNVDENGICEGLTIGTRADFNITLSLLQCSEDNSDQTLNVRVLGFGTFQISVSQLCNCSCQGQRIEASPLCSGGNGTLECGVCDCNAGRFGDLCQCDATGTTGNNNMTTCPNGPNGLVCSGRGVCVCGSCECQTFSDGRMFFGQVCECDNFQCDRDPVTGLTCGGSERGVCTCDGQCECLTSPISGFQFTGSSCDCSPDNNTCIDTTAGNIICSGNGNCVCGECNCSKGYTGQFCEICTDITECPIISCNVTRLCAQCAYNLTTEGCEDCQFQMVNTPDDVDVSINGITSQTCFTCFVGMGVVCLLGNEAITCDFTDDDDCDYRYFVALDNDGNTQPVNINNQRECPDDPLPLWVFPVAILVALLILGIIALILIKVLLVLMDIMEVNKFKSEVQNPAFRKNENPLFQSPNKEYKNPVYGQ